VKSQELKAHRGESAVLEHFSCFSLSLPLLLPEFSFSSLPFTLCFLPLTCALLLPPTALEMGATCEMRIRGNNPMGD